MCFFENEFFLNIFKHFKNQAFPIVVPVVTYLSSNHWHELILESLEALKNIIKDIDEPLYEKYAGMRNSPYLHMILNPDEFKEERVEKEAIWESLKQKAMQNCSNLILRPIPYSDDHIVGQFNGLDNGNVLFVD